MKKGGQKAKANAHERRIAKIFTEIWYPNGDGEFRKTPDSGGWDKRAFPGDIVPLKFMPKMSGAVDAIIDRNFPFIIECKNWRDEHVKHFFCGLYGKESELFRWMEQAENDAQIVGLMPLVVFKLFRTSDLVMWKYSDYAKISEIFGSFGENHFILKKIKKEKVIHSLNVMLLDQFIDWIDWSVYKFIDKGRYIRSFIKKEK